MHLQLLDVSKQYQKGTYANQGLTFDLYPGIYGLLGPNGAGKTTLLKMLATVLKPTSGDIRLDNISILKHPNALRDILGYLPQYFGTYEQLSGKEFLLYIAAMRGLPKDIATTRVKMLLTYLNLDSASGAKISSYSGGMKQRIGIAQALINSPKLLILDEPTVGLDPAERVRFRNLLAEMAKDTIIILSTHIVSDIDTIADHVGIMNKGRLISLSTQNDIVSKTVPYVYELPEPEFVELKQPDDNILDRKQSADGSIVRFFSSEKIAGSTATQATLEDAYLVLTRA